MDHRGAARRLRDASAGVRSRRRRLRGSSAWPSCSAPATGSSVAARRSRVGKQGWQASLDWRQRGETSEVHLAGPFGVGAIVLELVARGAFGERRAAERGTVRGAARSGWGSSCPSTSCATGCSAFPTPAATFELTRNAQDRALESAQAGWNIDIRSLHAESAAIFCRRGWCCAARMCACASRWTAGSGRSDDRPRPPGRRRPSSTCSCISSGGGADGYHELQTCFQFVDLCDDISIEVRSDGAIRRARRRRGRRAGSRSVRARRARAQGGVGLPARRGHRAWSSGFRWAPGWAAAARMRRPCLVALNRLWGLGWSADATRRARA